MVVGIYLRNALRLMGLLGWPWIVLVEVLLPLKVVGEDADTEGVPLQAQDALGRGAGMLPLSAYHRRSV